MPVAVSPSPSASPPGSVDLSGLQTVNSLLSESGNNWVLGYVGALAVLVTAWFAVRTLARRDVGFASSLYRKIDPRAQALQTWISLAPATFVYMACWTATTIVVQGSPPQLIDALTKFNSTNIVGLVTAPIRSMVVSALLVAESGAGFLLYVLIYVLIVARLEHRLGSARTIVVWLTAHVGASALIVTIELIAIKMGVAKEKLAMTTDVGVSYVMVGSLGAYAFWVGRKWRPWYLGALAIGIVAPAIIFHTIWDIGHLVATIFGTLAGALFALRDRSIRPRISWRALTAHPARKLEPREVDPVASAP